MSCDNLGLSGKVHGECSLAIEPFLTCWGCTQPIQDFTGRHSIVDNKKDKSKVIDVFAYFAGDTDNI